MYDLVMALRHDRENSTRLGVWKLICRLAADHHAQDQAERGGRRSWRPAKAVIARRPWLTISVLARSAKPKKPSAKTQDATP